ncbi:hypothetical protein CRYUN_Cryun12cG0099900 [Craigia yunnanensis]
MVFLCKLKIAFDFALIAFDLNNYKPGLTYFPLIIQQLPTHLRPKAADSLYFEAQCRVEDPVYGCVGLIFLLQQQIHNAENQLAKTQAEIAIVKSQAQRPQAQQLEVESDLNNLLQQQLDTVANLSCSNQASSKFM